MVASVLFNCSFDEEEEEEEEEGRKKKETREMLVLVVSSFQVWLITRLFISFVISFIYCFNVFCQTNAFLYFSPLYFSCTQDIKGGEEEEEDCQVDRDYWRG